jgi:putative pyruvate formate lyase activating enzyme
MSFTASYEELFASGRLEKIAESLEHKTQKCTLCPHNCGIDRTSQRNGRCRSGLLPIVSSWSPHFGEEPPLVGRRGSGTIFFTNCNLACIFCQNYDISHLGYGKEVSYDELARMMVSLQDRGCHNINFVTPTHMICAIVKALLKAVPMGLRLPLVYNSGGYDSTETLRLVEGVFDIYMPDFKYADDEVGFNLSGVKHYSEVARKALREMFHQVGDLRINSSGIAFRGLMVRHLVLPNNRAGTYEVIDFLSSISKNLYLNIMDQFRPMYRAREHPDLRRGLTSQELDEALNYARNAGLTRVNY